MKHEKSLASPYDRGQPTAPRYSFLDRELLREDTTYQDKFRKVRVISYASPDPEARQLREDVEAQGMLLGRKDEENNQSTQFVIPVSARPLTHDRSLQTSNELAYSDDELFYDMGRLLRGLADQGGNRPYELQGHISFDIALVEFTKQEEPKVLLVPGFENRVKAVEDPDVLLNRYAVRIHEEFGERFMHSAESFIEGYGGQG